MAVEECVISSMQERIFNASREQIWDVITKPDIVSQWWGPEEYTTIVYKMDFRVGGEWCFIHMGVDGAEFGFHGVCTEIIPLEKVSDTFNFEPIPGDHELVETLTLEDMGDGTTKMTSTPKCKSIEDLEGMISSGMESGATESWDRLAVLIQAI